MLTVPLVLSSVDQEFKSILLSILSHVHTRVNVQIVNNTEKYCKITDVILCDVIKLQPNKADCFFFS